MPSLLNYLSAIFLLSSAAAFSETNDPIGLYPANGNGADISANHHPDASGFYSYEAGKSGMAFSFEGIDKYLSLGDWFMQQTFSLGFWMRDNATPAAPQKSGALVGGQYNFNKGTNYWDVRSTTGDGNYQVETNNGGSPIPFSITQGAWHYILMARSNLNLQLFVDGVLQGSSTGTATDSFGFNEGIRLGTDRDGLHQWKGALDEIRFYDRALNNFEIAALSKDGADAEVLGTANPYLAGQANGSTLDGDTAPAQAPIAIPVVANHDIIISASGSVGTSGGTATGLPNGGPDISHTSANGIASYAGPGGALVGVFLSAAAPPGTTPAGLDYTAGGQASLSAQINSPLIGQVFFIGDRQGGSGVGHFIAPPSATGLFLAVIDNGNSNNTGSFSVHIVDTTLDGPYQRVISGGSNIYGADSSVTLADGTSPPAVTFAAASGQVLKFTGVSGTTRIDTTTDNGGNGANGPDGGTYQAPVNVAAVGGISGFKASTTGALVGVFLAGTSAPATAPATLDFTGVDSTNFLELSPLLGQVFFIGDGLTSDGKPQSFNVPAGATGLYLGIADGSNSGGAPGGYTNNDGQYDASFQLSVTPNAVLKISAKAASTGDPANGLTAQIGDDITYTFHWENTGTAKAHNLQVGATIPIYYEDVTDLQKQFIRADLTYNQYGHYVAATSSSAKNAKVVWDVADLDPGSSQEVTLKVHLNNNLRNVQTIVLPNNYSVSSTSQQPVTKATGFSSGSANVNTATGSALRFTGTPDATSIAPGKYVSYTLKLTNQSHLAVPAAAAVFTLPTFTRFVRIGLTKDTPLSGAAGSPMGALAPHPGSVDQVLIYFGQIPALGSSTVTVTVQAQWVEPSEVPGQALSLLDYGAAFLSGTSIATFQAALTTPNSTNYFEFIKDRSKSTGITFGDSGTIPTLLKGNASNGPDIRLTKSLANSASDTLNDGLGNAVDIVNPGKIVTYLLTLANEGKSSAEDVYIQDAIPSKTSYVNNSAQIINTSSSAQASLLEEPTVEKGTLDGRHISFKGLHLGPKDLLVPNDFVVISYQVKVASGKDAPAIGTILTTDSAVDPATGLLAASTVFTSSSPHTSSGLTINGPLEVAGKIAFAQPRIRVMLPNPEVSPNVANTRAALDAVYASNVDAKPLVDKNDALSFIPGMERFYVHYENQSSGIVSNVDLVVPLPAHTAFYRARFVTLIPNPVSEADGIWPGTIDSTAPPTAALSVPGILSTGKSITAHFGSLGLGQKGDLLVEVIITPDAIQKDGPFTGEIGDAKVVIKNSKQSAEAPFPRVKVAHRGTATSSPAAHGTFPAQATIPIVPQIGILKVSPAVVNVGSDFGYKFFIFNYGDTKTPACTFHFVQPANTTYVLGSFTSLYNGKSNVTNPVPETDLVCSWDYIPPHTAVAVNYVLSASGAVNIPITDFQDRVVMNYAGELDVTPSPIGVIATGAPGDKSIVSVTGHSLHQFPVSGVSIRIIDLGNGVALVDEPETMYKVLGAGGVKHIEFECYVGPADSIGIGNTSAGYLLGNRSHGAQLSKFGASPVTTIVPAGCMELLLPNELGVAAGSGALPLPKFTELISQDGVGLISQDGAGLISQDGSGLISQDGSGLVTHDGGKVVSNDGGSLLTKSGTGLTAQANTTALIAAGAGNLIAAGAGNLVKKGQGN